MYSSPFPGLVGYRTYKCSSSKVNASRSPLTVPLCLQDGGVDEDTPSVASGQEYLKSLGVSAGDIPVRGSIPTLN